jgi:hypothetical protein
MYKNFIKLLKNKNLDFNDNIEHTRIFSQCIEFILHEDYINTLYYNMTQCLAHFNSSPKEKVVHIGDRFVTKDTIPIKKSII